MSFYSIIVLIMIPIWENPSFLRFDCKTISFQQIAFNQDLGTLCCCECRLILVY